MNAAPGFGIYVHWPFCKSKCPYCDFNSHVRERIDEARWRDALLAELDHYAGDTAGRVVTSVFFGGGTPSLMEPRTTGAILDRIARSWSCADDVEVTLEANPNSAEAARFAGFRGAGVNRLSLGVQSLDDRALRFLGRGHDAAEARAAVALAGRLFPRHSFDLIYARPDQTREAWAAELADALVLAGEHLSVYQLTIEPGTAFHAPFARGELRLPDDDSAAALYDLTNEMLAAAGLPAYEISNHARPGAECRHNLIYWRAEDYVGVGPGAHGRITVNGRRVATRQARAPETWLSQVEAAGHGTAERAALDPDSVIEECLMMGLRLAEGIDLERFAKRTGRPFDDVVDRARLAKLVAARFLERTSGRIRATPLGRKVLNALLADLR